MREKEYSFDILRVIAMTMVIIIHVSNIYSRSYGDISMISFYISLIFNTICRISVPIFLMISGALLLDRKFNKDKYIKRIKRIIILIIVWDIIYLIWEYLFFNITYKNLFKLLYEPYRAHLWFLYIIVGIYIIQPLLRLLMNKIGHNTKIVLLIIWIILSTLSLFNIKIAHLSTIFCHSGFFILGKYLYDYAMNKNIKKHKVIILVVMIILFGISATSNLIFSLLHDNYFKLFYTYRSPFIIISSMLFFLLICNIYTYRRPYKLVLKFSEMSLGFYLIHGIFLDITEELYDYTAISSLIGIPMFSCLVFLMSCFVVYIMKKIPVLRKIF